ncbi:MAG: DUF368 domain-containing protein [Halorhabdus sp.]
MGTADSVPGVSGGTIAFITGIYERLISAIAGLNPRVLRYIVGIHRPAGRRAFLEQLRELDVPFLVVLGSGLGTALVIVSRIMHAALNDARALTFAFFFGLIAASAIILYEHVAIDTTGQIAAGIVGFALAFLVSGVTTGSTVPHGLPIVFTAGVIAITAMILPGVSGAFFLVLLGQYDYLSGVLTEFVDQVLRMLTGNGSLQTVIELGTTVIVFAVGAILGLLAFARVIQWALAEYRYETITFLVSLMVGALRLPVVEVFENTAAWTPVRALLTLLAAGIGALGVLILDQYTSSLDY